MTERIRGKYIAYAVDKKLLPIDAHRMPALISLTAPDDLQQPIQFWQLYSVLGQDRIVRLIQNFYRRVYADEEWFRSVFARLSPMNNHINAQAAMWIDVMGGGLAYHGGEYRLSVHHSHNAMELMNERGAKRWIELMVQTLEDPDLDLGDDPRVRASINSFLSYFMGKYADEFSFESDNYFGECNAAVKRRINLMNLSDEEIEALHESELQDALSARGVDLSMFVGKAALVSKAQSL